MLGKILNESNTLSPLPSPPGGEGKREIRADEPDEAILQLKNERRQYEKASGDTGDKS